MSGAAERPRGPAGAGVHLNARVQWMERYGEYVAAAARWRRTALAALAVAALATAVAGWLGSRPRMVPYVVEVDRLGRALAAAPAERAAPADPRVVRSALARFVAAARAVTADAAVQRAMVDEAYRFVDRRSDAAGQLDRWYRERNPFERMAAGAVEVAVRSVLALSADSWRVEWDETERAGGRESVRPFQATLTVRISPPRDERQLLANPLGVYVVFFSWAERL